MGGRSRVHIGGIDSSNSSLDTVLHSIDSGLSKRLVVGWIGEIIWAVDRAMVDENAVAFETPFIIVKEFTFSFSEFGEESAVGYRRAGGGSVCATRRFSEGLSTPIDFARVFGELKLSSVCT